MNREREPDLRRHPRARVAWPVTVEAGDRLLYFETMNLSPFGAKLRLDDSPLEPGTLAQFHFRPADGRPLDVQAIVWRIDPDGLAFGVDAPDFTFLTDASESIPPQT